MRVINYARNKARMALTATPAAVVLAASAVAGVGITAAPAMAAAAPYAVSTINSLQDPVGVAVAPNGKRAYILDGDPAANGEDALFAVSTSTNTIAATITSPGFTQPVALAVNPDGSYAYVLNEDGTVSVVSTASNAVTATIGTANSSSASQAIAISPDGTTGYVSKGGLGVVSVLNLTKDSVTRTISVPSPSALALSPNGKELYVSTASAEGPGVSVISTATDAVTGSISGLISGGSSLVVSPDGSSLYIMEGAYGAVAIAKTATSAVVDTVTAFDEPDAAVLSPSGKSLYVTDGSSVAIMDTSTDAVTNSIAIGQPAVGASSGVAAIAITPDGNSVYVAGTINYLGVLAVINTATDTLSGTVPIVGEDPGALVVSPDGEKVYVANRGFNLGGTFGDGITVIGTATETAVATIPASTGLLGPGPNGLAVSPDGKTLYVANDPPLFGDNTVSVINTATDVVTGTITVGSDPAGITVSPDGKTAYVANSADATVSVIDTATNTVINTINVVGSPDSMAVSPDDKTLYVGGSGISVIDTTSDTVTATIPDATASSPIVLSPDGQALYSGNGAVISTKTDAVARQLPIGCGLGMAISPDGKTLYVAACGGGVLVIDTSSGNVTATVADPSFSQNYTSNPDIIAVAPNGKAVYLADSDNDSVHVITLVTQAPKITSGSSATFTVGAKGTFTVTATGIPTPALSESGSLPGGVRFTDNKNGTATLSGTPAAGTGRAYKVTLEASNGVGTAAMPAFTLTVRQAAKVTSKTAATFTVGRHGSFAITTTGYPAAATVTESGTLPKGVTFKNNKSGTATISGTPAAGTGKAYAITLNASNGVGPTASQAFRLIVDQAPKITSAANATFTYHKKGTFEIKTTGYPVTTITESGALPKGLTFKNDKNGTATISGTPTLNAAKTYMITIKANNGVTPAATITFKLILQK